MSVAFVFVLLAARAAIVVCRGGDWTPGWLLSCVGQDAAVACAFMVLELALRRRARAPAALSLLFWALSVYVAINVMVASILPSPLTWPLIRAAGGPIADSIRLYATVTNVGLMLGVLAIGALGVKAAVPPARWMVAALGATAILGVQAASHHEMWGVHRNPVVALVSSVLPVAGNRAAVEEWRTPPADARPSTDLTFLRGLAAGRNVVLIGLESTGAEHLRMYGAERDPMPALEALAAEAVVFDHAYAVSPDSIRSLFSVVCSRDPAFDVPVSTLASAECAPVFAALQDRGYRTALFHSGRFSYLGMEEVIDGRGYETREDAGHIGGNHESSFGVDEPATIARMLQWVDGLAEGQRFALHYMPVAGHHPYVVNGPATFGDATEYERYLSALSDGDRSIGVLVDGLRARGLLHETIVVVYGDHGQAFGRHPGNVGHTFYLFEENIRVPFFVALPGVLTQPRRSTTTVSLADVAPTMADLLGLDPDGRRQGRSALPPGDRVALFFTDYGEPLAGLRDGRWKFIRNPMTGRAWLFDLHQDPSETVNRAGDHPERVDVYARRVAGWSAAQKASLLSGPATARPESPF